MSDIVPTPKLDLVRLSSEVVAAYVSRNAVPAETLPELMGAVHASLVSLATPAAPAVDEQPPMPSPAEVKRSVKADGITSFLDGRSYKTLKRHLATHGFTPDTYKDRFGLPHDYPMTAPAYAAQRSELAKAVGLGQARQRRNDAPRLPPDEAPPGTADVPPKPKRGRSPAAKAAAEETPQP